MKSILVGLLSYIIFVFGIVIFNANPVEAGHAEWHEGPSCGQCHCPVDYECTASLPDGCSCQSTELSEGG